jgi:hypothetical protein
MSTFAIVVTIIAVMLFGAFLLLGAWIDGRRQSVRSKGLHPTTTSEGQVEAIETETREQAHGSSSQNDQG